MRFSYVGACWVGHRGAWGGWAEGRGSSDRGSSVKLLRHLVVSAGFCEWAEKRVREEGGGTVEYCGARRTGRGRGKGVRVLVSVGQGFTPHLLFRP